MNGFAPQLLTIARESIEHGLQHARCFDLDTAVFPEELQAPRACFVTLKSGQALRGCIGSLEAVRPLAADIHENAYAAAFRDSRFAPLAASEWPAVRLSLSILSSPEVMPVADETALLTALRPGIDGVILEYGQRRATFLPAVWEMLPDPIQFLLQLKLKAGLPEEFWAEELRIYRYTATQIDAHS